MALDRSKVLETAQKHLAKGNYDKAIAEYQRLVKEDPADVRTWLKIGDLFTRKGARKEACQTYLRVAQHYADQGFFLKAVAVHKQILKLDPSRLDVSVKLAEMYQKLDMTNEASAAYEHVAGALARAGQVDKALAVLKKMVELDPENIPGRIKLAEALSKAGKAPQAAAEFEVGADLLEKQGRLDDYIKVAERLLFHRPGDAKTARKLAGLYLERNDAKRALAKLQLCFKADPRDVQTLELLARAFHVLGQTPKTISVYRETARILGEQGKEDSRARILKRILELDPSDQEARQALAAHAEKSQARRAQPEPPASAVVQSGTHTAPDAGEEEIQALDDDELEVLEPDEEDIIVVEEDAEAAEAEAPAEPEPAAPSGAPARPSAGPGQPSVPPEAAREAQIARLLTECDVFMRYGLKNKVIGQLGQVLELDPNHVEARERLKDMYVEMGHTDQAVAQLHALADQFEQEKPAVAELYLQQILELNPEDALAKQRLSAASQPAPASDVADLEAPVPPDEEDVVFIDESLAPPPDEETMALLEEPERPEDFDEVATGQVEVPSEVAGGEVEVEPVREPRWAMQPPALEPDEQAPELEADPNLATEPEAEVAEPPAAAGATEPPAEALLEEEALAPISPEEFDAAPVEPSPVEAEADARLRVDQGGGEIEEILDEAEFFLAQGMIEEARSSLQDALEEHPNHPLLLDKLSDLDEAAEAGDDEPELTVEPATDQSFELAERLAEELGESTADATDDQIDVETVFAQFKKGVAETVSADDTDTHFDLGIAYKEMGLVDDAIGEFQLCTQQPARECMAHTMIGLCYVEKGALAEAIDHFKKGLYAEHKSEREELGLYFELGHAYEMLNDANEALYYYEKVKKRDPNFRGVDERIKALSQPQQGGQPDASPNVGMDDVDRAFDDLLRED
ncbi:MAG: tetratricopeptide repeat protein [Myxococcota bacterium]